MTKTFKGRVIAAGEVTAEAVVTTQGFNTLASMQMMFIQPKTKCVDQTAVGQSAVSAADHRLHHRRHVPVFGGEIR